MNNYFRLYEVVDSQNISIISTPDVVEAVKQLRWHKDSRLWLSVWDTPSLDAHPIGEPVDITPVVTAVLVSELERSRA